MLTITIPGTEYYDDSKSEFVHPEATKLELEHSLVSISKWESKWEKPFLATGEKTNEEILSYIQMMVLSPENSPEEILTLTDENVKEIQQYIDAKRTATWFVENKISTRTGETITSELVYYWMIAFQIPFECQYWHINRLFTLIRVCNEKNAKPKKMSRAEVAQRQRDLNAQRKAQYNTTG